MSGESPGPPEQPQRIEALFHELLELPAAARESRLAEEASRDAAVATRVRALLAAAGEADGFFAGLPERIASAQSDEPVADLRGRRMGAYVIDGLIGRGGMGAVYRAHRADEQFEKSVAIKLVPMGLLTASAQERFRRERQMLARLEHPNIARLLDGGVLEDGTPYLVMELVEGQVIDQWCDARKLGVRERVKLLLPVLDAVQYAHQSLVLHSDIKPDNVLVSDAGAAKLIDFGISRSLDDAATESTLTRRASPLTPSFASPEQLRGDVLTTASDVHALGGLLFALLAGRAPFVLAGKSTAEIERIVTEEPPPALSTVAPAEREAALRGDLDTIVRRALQKDPARRYASAGALADDLRAHLDGRPIAARRDSAAYVFSRFVRRHRAAVAVTVGALALVVGFAFSLAALSARHAREVAAERDHAQREARTAEEVAGFLATLFDGADPDVAGGRELTAHELLDQSARRLDADLADQPEVRARMSSIMATLYEKLGRTEDGLAMAERATATQGALPGGDPVRRAASLEQQARLLQMLDRLDEADSVLGFAERLRREHGGGPARMAPSIAARGYLASDRFAEAAADSLLALADSLYRTDARPDSDALAFLADYRGYISLSSSPRVADSLFALASAIGRARKGPAHSTVAGYDRGRGMALLRMERFAEAESVLRSVRTRLVPLFGPDHQSVIAAEMYLANALSNLERPAEAESLLLHVLAVRRQRLGDAHPNTLNVLNMLGLMHREAGHDAQAIQYLREAADGYRRRGPGMAKAVLIIEGNLADALLAAGRLDEAETILRGQRAGVLADPRHTPWQLAKVDLAFARLAHGRGQIAAAERGYRAALGSFSRAEGGGSGVSASIAQFHLGRLLLETGRPDSALVRLGAAVNGLAAEHGGNHPGVLRARVLMAGALSATGRLAEADTMLARAREAQVRKLPAGHVDRREADGIARAHAARMARAAR